MSNQILIWGIWRLGIFVVFVEPLLSHFRCAAGHNILPGSPLLWRSAVAAEMYSQCAKTFRWDVCVKVTSTWMQGHCVIYITCYKFKLFLANHYKWCSMCRNHSDNFYMFHVPILLLHHPNSLSPSLLCIYYSIITKHKHLFLQVL